MKVRVELEVKDIELIKSIVEKYMEDTNFPEDGFYRRCPNEEAWEKLVSQIVVIGRADRVHELDMSSLSLNVLEELSKNRQEMLSHVNDVFANAGVRYVSRGKISNKAQWVVDNYFNHSIVKEGKFILLEGLPEIYGLSYKERRDREIKARNDIKEVVKGFGLKSSSDFLIEIGYAKTLVAFDVRITNFINKVLKPDTAIESLNPTIYQLLEDSFQKVHDEIGIYPSTLDRILFQNSESIIENYSKS